MSSGQSVVVVDGMPETAAVLQAVFEPRGLRVDRMRSYSFDDSHPSKHSVLVVHDDGTGNHEKRSKYGAAPRVVIGSITSTDSSPDETYLSPLFHFSELIKAVEGLLDEQGSTTRAA